MNMWHILLAIAIASGAASPSWKTSRLVFNCYDESGNPIDFQASQEYTLESHAIADSLGGCIISSDSYHPINSRTDVPPFSMSSSDPLQRLVFTHRADTMIVDIRLISHSIDYRMDSIQFRPGYYRVDLEEHLRYDACLGCRWPSITPARFGEPWLQVARAGSVSRLLRRCVSGTDSGR